MAVSPRQSVEEVWSWFCSRGEDSETWEGCSGAIISRLQIGQSLLRVVSHGVLPSAQSQNQIPAKRDSSHRGDVIRKGGMTFWERNEGDGYMQDS